MTITVKMNDVKNSNLVRVDALNVGNVIKYYDTTSIFLGKSQDNFYAWDIKRGDKKLNIPEISFFCCGDTKVELLQKPVEVIVG